MKSDDLGIDPAEFFASWTKLCSRFSRPVERQEAADYHEYVTTRLTREQIRAAFRSLWATRTFFPSPADFVRAANADVLFAIRRAAAEYRTDRMVPWLEMIGGKGSLAHLVVRELGGIDVVAGLVDKGPRALREEIDVATEMIVSLDGGLDSLASGRPDYALPRPLERADLGGLTHVRNVVVSGMKGLMPPTREEVE